MAGLVPAIHVLVPSRNFVDGRNKSGHDEKENGMEPGCATAAPYKNFVGRIIARHMWATGLLS